MLSGAEGRFYFTRAPLGSLSFLFILQRSKEQSRREKWEQPFMGPTAGCYLHDTRDWPEGWFAGPWGREAFWEVGEEAPSILHQRSHNKLRAFSLLPASLPFIYFIPARSLPVFFILFLLTAKEE